MAASSEVSWTSCIKPLLAGPSSSFNKYNISSLIEGILRSEKEILQHDEDYEAFYSSFVVLSAHYICTTLPALSQSEAVDIPSACKVLLQFLLQRIQKNHDNSAISPKQLMVCIWGMCKGSSCLSKTDLVTAVALLKTAQIPTHIRTGDADVEEPSEQKELKRPRLDTGKDIFTQLTSVFNEVSSGRSTVTEPTIESLTTEGEAAMLHMKQDNQVPSLVCARNVSTLYQLGGGETLLAVCTHLPMLRRYHLTSVDVIMASTEPVLSLPLTATEAASVRSSIQQVLHDVSIVSRLVSLPLLEPLTPNRIDKVLSLTLSCLYAAVSVTVASSVCVLSAASSGAGKASSKDDDQDNNAAALVQKALEVFSSVKSSIQQSSRAGGKDYQNLHLCGCLLFVHTLQKLVSLTPPPPTAAAATEPSRPKEGPLKLKPGDLPKPKEPTVRPASSSQKASASGFSVLSVALSTQLLDMLSTLMDDLHMDGQDIKDVDGSSTGKAEDVLQDHSAARRVNNIFMSTNVANLLITIMNEAFRKGISVKRSSSSSSASAAEKREKSGDYVVEIISDHSSSSSSESQTFYEDDFSTSDDSSADDDDDEDSEPILGQWLEETLSPEDATPSNPPAPPSLPDDDDSPPPARHRHSSVTDSPCYVPDKKEPDGYLDLASSVLMFLTRHFLATSSPGLVAYLRGRLSEQHMASLATIIRDMDHAKTMTTACGVSFSSSLSRFCHMLISSGVLSEPLQESLLHQLGLSPASVDPWPLSVAPRSLAVLAEVLLLRLQTEREAGEGKYHRSEMAIINIWTRFLAQLKETIINFDNATDHWDDLNVEHAQLLIFLFHSLPLMQKKLLLLQLAQCVVSIAENCQQGGSSRLHEMVPLPLSRLLLILDYLLHNFYDPPAALIQQVQWNLFGTYTASTDTESSHQRYFVCSEVEDNFAKTSSSNKESYRPRFYNLAPADYNKQDTPKVDGLACSFLLSSPDVLTYDSFYEACVALLGAGANYHRNTTKDKARTNLDSSSIHYHIVVCWRLLGCLPPSAAYLTLLQSTEEQPASHILHTLRWAPRLAHKAFRGWTKDYLVKQGLTTQKAESLITDVIKHTETVNYDVRVALDFIHKQVASSPNPGSGELVAPSDLPSPFTMYMLDAVLVKVRMSLDDLFTKSMASEVEPQKEMEIADDLLKSTVKLIQAYALYIKSSLLHQISGENTSASVLRGYSAVLSIGSENATRLATQGPAVMAWLPANVKAVVDAWNDVPPVTAWKDSFSNSIIPVEEYLDAIQAAHIVALSKEAELSVNTSLKQVFQALVTFCSDLIKWTPERDFKEDIIQVLFPLLFDATCDNAADKVCECVEPVLSRVDSEVFVERTYQYVIQASHHLITNHAKPESGVDERVLQDCVSFLEHHLEKPAGKVALDKFYCQQSQGDLVTLLLSAATENLSTAYATKVLKFFNTLFQLAEKNPNDVNYMALCSSLSKLATVDSAQLQSWLSRMIMGPPADVTPTPNAAEQATSASSNGAAAAGVKTHENRLLLQNLTTYIVKENSLVGEEVASAILTALIPMGSEILSPKADRIGFSELMVVMATLAGAGSGSGHIALFEAATGWLRLCKSYLSRKLVVRKLDDDVSGSSKHQIMLESACYLLSYIGEILTAMKNSDRAASPPYMDVDITQPLSAAAVATAGIDQDSDWTEEVGGAEDEDSTADDSDEESLNSKLCTYTITQKEFMNQHWYHCHTCKMVDGVGVCTVCAKVCHKDHDISYAKYGSFFCDCGAKEDGSCTALVKRSSSGGGAAADSSQRDAASMSPFSTETMLPSLLRRRLFSPHDAEGNTTASNKAAEHKQQQQQPKAKEVLCKQIEGLRETLVGCLAKSKTCSVVLELLQLMMPAILDNYQKVSPLGSTVRAQKALDDLRTLAKSCDTTDTLMTATLGSQEGAFENVRMNYSGDQGQTIRQLMTSHVLRRVAMCCLSSPHGKRQHLAVSHEKGKVTILQLSALLKQADSSKRKLTLTLVDHVKKPAVPPVLAMFPARQTDILQLKRLSSAPIPFTVLSISGNPCNEDFLAVCGLKDCHVLTFTGNGSVSDHLVLHPSLESGNFIIKALWLPGSQTELAIVTADFVKIYDLSADALSPQYYFLLPSGKIRDATFITREDQRHLVLMSSSGYIYAQQMDDQSSAKHGSFYITNIVELSHADIKESNGQVAGGGVSVYYSHALQLLFFSFAQGKSFAAALAPNIDQLTALFPITFKSSGNGKSGNQPLVQWSEVPNHPGLVCSMTQASNNPVILMMKPDAITIQEIKILPAKAKIQDMVAIRHSGSNTDQRTTLILLCEDGSLRIFMANVDHTNYWMSPALLPQSAITSLKPAKKKKAAKPGRPSSQVSFPIDFFEHCTQTNDIEYGGNDILQVYNTAQIKQRLNTTGTYIAACKPAGFNIEIINTNASTVIVGLRIGVGAQSVERCPAYFEVYGRNVQVSTVRSRFIDIPLTRDESLQSDKKMTLTVGASVDPASVTIVDSIKVYVKTKEAFGWPEDTEEFSAAAATAAASTTAAAAVDSKGTATAASGSATTLVSPPGVSVDAMTLPLTSMDRLLAGSLEVLDGVFSTQHASAEADPQRSTAQELATQLLNLPTPTSVQQHTHSLLAALFHTRQAYYNHKDQAQLAWVIQCLGDAICSPVSPSTLAQCSLDPEAFQRLVLTARAVAVARPSNLVKFTEKDTTLVQETSITSSEGLCVSIDADDPAAAALQTLSQMEPEESSHFMAQLVDCFWRLHAARPANPDLAPACLPGLTHIEATVGAIVEILHAFTLCDHDNVALATKLYMQLLMAQDTQVSFACKQALIRVLRPKHRRHRRVYIPSPPRCSTPGGAAVDEDDDSEDKTDKSMPQPPPTPQEGLPPPPARPVLDEGHGGFEMEPPEAVLLEPPELEPGVPGPSALEALLAGGAANFHQMLDISPDADDEAMVELAIALSLQEQPGGAGGAGGLAGLAGSVAAAAAAAAAAHHHDASGGHLSDTTASAPGSDDEAGSTAATEGSTLRTSPADHNPGSGAGSDSGGSNMDSVSVSGRSSAYGETAAESMTTGARSETSSVGMPSNTGPPEHAETDAADVSLHCARVLLLQRLIQYMPQIRDIGGVRAIPYMQVLLMLTSDLESEEDKDRAVLDSLLAAMITELKMSEIGGSLSASASQMSCRTLNHEVQLVVMRLLSVLMSRSKAGTKPAPESSSSFISTNTASALIQSNGLDFCLSILKTLLNFWKKAPVEEEGSVLPGQLLKPQPPHPPPDMSPFFLKQYVKGHATDVFEDYPQLLTEMVLRLPYQMKKIAESCKSIGVPTFEQSWLHILADYMMLHHQPQFVRRQVRKVLLYVCGTKDKYRQLRDLHALEAHMGQVQTICSKAGVMEASSANPTSVILPYDVLISLMEHLKACSEIASSRTGNWQRFCVSGGKDDSSPGVLGFLVAASIALDEGVAPVMLQLLQCALCTAPPPPPPPQQPPPPTAKPSPARTSKTQDLDADALSDEALCSLLVQNVSKAVSRELLLKFMRCFLLESNATSVRWQAHALILHIYRSSTGAQQESLLELMWSLWPELPAYGRKAAQFVDLLGFFALKTPQTSEKKTRLFVERAVAVLRGQNKILANHPNGSIYNMLQGLVDFDGYYLESDPCLVCNNPEVPYSNIKLSAIKVDSKFTTTTQIVKLVGSHTISKITVRISDLKRTKMVRVMNIYYNNRSVQAVVELKNRPGLWHKAKKVVLTAGQTDIKVEFPLPIVACNLLIEYSDFYDNLQASTETLQCPRCSASVPANPGVCGNCGENVFQCHKCRAINYDEKDPFLCNACGFCKYAKFDLSLTAKPCCAVDPIENEDDRKKATSNINSLLEKADRLYRQLQLDKPVLEALLIRISEHGGMEGAGTEPASNVHKAIQQLAQRYCGDCKNSFDELSKIIQRVLATRKELVEYDRQQREAASAAAMSNPSTPVMGPSRPADIFRAPAQHTTAAGLIKPREKLSSCYGCASATVEHCVTLLRALATHSGLRQYLCGGQGLLRELLEYNLRRGAPGVRHDVRHLICLLTRDNTTATEELNLLLTHTIAVAIKGHRANTDFAASVRHEMLLLSNTVQREDSCWEQRVRCVLKLFLFAMKIRSPVVLECIALPCLRILHHIIQPDIPTTKKNKNKSVDNLCSVKPGLPELHVNLRRYLIADPKASFSTWRKNTPQKVVDPSTSGKKKKEDKPKDREIERRCVKVKYLMEKYGLRWRNNVLHRKRRSWHIQLEEKTWLRQALFSASSRSARQTACSILEASAISFSRKKHILDMLTGFLVDVGRSGESSNEFLGVYKLLIADGPWKMYLAVKGVPQRLGQLISAEIDNLTMLEETTLSSDLSQGFALKALTELLVSFLECEPLKKHYKSRLVGVVLDGYLSLRKLVIQRTKLIDDTQEKLLELLEGLTTGTESETRDFMAVCVQTVEKYPLKDNLSPVFIFERLCSIIYPEENDVGDIFLSLEKDPQQEDFLQGRMLGNPYSSSEPGLGPLMRDVKNKICQDCELVALLEDDTGMELLVCNKIISLDLPVKDVYKKIWSPEHGEGEPMRIVYRMRGLLGDATEDMVNTLDSGKDDSQNAEEVYSMASVMSECGGLLLMLKRLAAIRDLVSGRQLMTVLLKLFSFCVKVKANRQQLILPQLNTISIMLGALNMALLVEQESGVGGSNKGGQTLSEQILQIMETILQEASSQPPETYKEFSLLCGDREQLMMLLDRINSVFVRTNQAVLQALMRLIPFLAFGDQDKMHALINHFKPYLDFNRYDSEHSQDEQVHLDCFCVIADGIEKNANGDRLKDLILDCNIVKESIAYIQQHAPPIKTLLATDTDTWSDFLSRPALPYILRVLCGLAAGHERTAAIIGGELVPVLHKLEQATSDEHVGTLAENLLDAVREHPTVAAKIEDIRQQTKAEKKRLAMAMRQKQLKVLGMTANEKGQVTVQSPVLKQMEELKEEAGLTCCICREGARYHPTKVLGIYTYTKRVNLDDGELKPRKTQGYTTVSHFNVVHIDCHLAAVRHARGREEWESAALQNANTRCNGLLPLWGPEVPESAFASCLARHNTYLQECTSIRDASYPYTVHDLKHVLLKFANGKSFSEDSGGGGKQSNMHLAPYIMHMALYVINTTRSVAREDKNLANFLKAAREKWLENCYETENSVYYPVLACLIMSREKWTENRLTFLKRLVVLAHVRAVAPGGTTSVTDKAVKEYSVYKPYVLLLALIDGFYNTMFKKVTGTDTWSSSLADFVRHNDQELLTQGEKLLKTFDEEILVCESFAEYCDVAGFLEVIPDPDAFLVETIGAMP